MENIEQKIKDKEEEINATLELVKEVNKDGPSWYYNNHWPDK